MIQADDGLSRLSVSFALPYDYVSLTPSACRSEKQLQIVLCLLVRLSGFPESTPSAGDHARLAIGLQNAGTLSSRWAGRLRNGLRAAWKVFQRALHQRWVPRCRRRV